MSDRCEHLTPDNTGFSTSHTRCTAKGKYQVGDFLYCGRHHLWHKVTHYRIKYKKAQTHISTLELAWKLYDADVYKEKSTYYIEQAQAKIKEQSDE